MGKLTWVVCTIVVGMSLCGRRVHGAVAFSENFSTGTAGPFLEQMPSGASPNFGGGNVGFAGTPRGYLRTIDDDYSLIDFLAQITVTIAPDVQGTDDRATIYFGMGDSGYGFGSDDRPQAFPHIYMDAYSSNSLSGGVGIWDSGFGGQLYTGAPHAGSGTHRLQMKWDSTLQRMEFAIQRNYTGGLFTPTTAIFGTGTNGADNGFTNLNSRIFFGGSNSDGGPAQFDDLVIVPEPAVIGWLSFAWLVTMRRRATCDATPSVQKSRQSLVLNDSSEVENRLLK